LGYQCNNWNLEYSDICISWFRLTRVFYFSHQSIIPSSLRRATYYFSTYYTVKMNKSRSPSPSPAAPIAIATTSSARENQDTLANPSAWNQLFDPSASKFAVLNNYRILVQDRTHKERVQILCFDSSDPTSLNLYHRYEQVALMHRKQYLHEHIQEQLDNDMPTKKNIIKNRFGQQKLKTRVQAKANQYRSFVRQQNQFDEARTRLRAILDAERAHHHHRVYE